MFMLHVHTLTRKVPMRDLVEVLVAQIEVYIIYQIYTFRKSTRIDKDTISVSKRRLPLPPEPLKLSRQRPVTNRWKQHLRRFAEQGRAVEVSARFWSWRICSQGSLDVHQASYARVIIQKDVENPWFPVWKMIYIHGGFSRHLLISLQTGYFL